MSVCERKKDGVSERREGGKSTERERERARAKADRKTERETKKGRVAARSWRSKPTSSTTTPSLVRAPSHGQTPEATWKAARTEIRTLKADSDLTEKMIRNHRRNAARRVTGHWNWLALVSSGNPATITSCDSDCNADIKLDMDDGPVRKRRAGSDIDNRLG